MYCLMLKFLQALHLMCGSMQTLSHLTETWQLSIQEEQGERHMLPQQASGALLWAKEPLGK